MRERRGASVGVGRGRSIPTAPCGVNRGRGLERGAQEGRGTQLEADVEAARSEVFSALNVATTLRHAIQHAEEASQRVSEELAKLAVEESEVRLEKERLEDDRAATSDGLRRAKEAAEASQHAKTARETELATARIELEWKSHNLQARERELAGLTARLTSLTDLEKARAGYTEAARIVLQQAGHRVVTAHVPDIKRGELDLVEFVRTHDPAVIVYDVPIPYEQNWTFLKLVRGSAGMRDREFVLTTTHKANLERLVGPTEAIEIVGKPFDLELVAAAVERALARRSARDAGTARPPPAG